ncbi:MAG: DNA cytosine methyltransferase, partial [Cyanobacteria bacterium HKST-UBA01]|nr:DNA cytosine methyltransferase [Cyanobacteria bacterium HKST-UBA01]
LRFGDAEALLPVRYISPVDIARLLGFSDQFAFPEDMTDQTRWRLIGNSVDVRAIRYLLAVLGFREDQKN